ncbi:DSBA oxidoreductase domain containing protein [Aphelenchoides fujianensis]|nr:DSBA oxidoreductase domain containing protein [Aphelenchoides fujianensis]
MSALKTAVAKKGMLKVFTDPVSPYSMCALYSLTQYEHRLPVQLDFRTVFNPAIIRASSNRPASENELKLKQWEKDLTLRASYWGFPYRSLTDFNERILKKHAVHACRLLTAARRVSTETQRAAMRVLYHRLFFEDKDIFSEEEVRAALDAVEFPNRERLFQLMKTKEIKEELHKNTDEALKHGAFGLFGSDRLPLLCHMLGVKFEGPLFEDRPLFSEHRGRRVHPE